MRKISEICLYYFRCTPHYPIHDGKLGSDYFIPQNAEEEAILASFLFESLDSKDTKVYDDILFCLGTQDAVSYSIKVSKRKSKIKIF